jgi:hypothetical protein
VIFLDATYPHLELKWAITPITLINVNHQNILGGIVFTAIQTADILEWILPYVWNRVNERLQCIIIDEDETFGLAFRLFFRTGEDSEARRKVHHILCACHKD